MYFNSKKKKIPVMVSERKLSADGSMIEVSHATVYMTPEQAEQYRKQQKDLPPEGLPLLPVTGY